MDKEYYKLIFNKLRTLITIVLITLSSYNNITLSQPDKSCKKINSKSAIKLYSNALSILNSNKTDAESIIDFDTLYKKQITNDNLMYAEELLLKAITEEPNYVQAYYTLAAIYYKLNYIKTKPATNTYLMHSIDCLKKAYSICQSFNNYIIAYYLGKLYYDEHEYKQAKDFFNTYLTNSSGNKLMTASKMHIHIETYMKLISNPVPFNPQSVQGLCTKNDEYLPLISPDGEIAFYSRKYDKQFKDLIVTKIVEEFMYSKRLTPVSFNEEIYGAGETMPSPFNEKMEQGWTQGASTITIDNNHLYLTLCEPPNKNGYRNCDIYSSDNINGNWTPLKNLGPNINGPNTWESQPSISSDGKILYFSSSRPENIGGTATDIYRSIKNNNGEWSKAENLGPKINTEYNEKSPFIHTDSRTLYFSSDGRYGVGGYDIYFSKYEAGKGWTEPINIGYPINSEDDEIGFIVSTNGKKAYFSSNKLHGEGGYDIYSFDLYEEVQPDKVILAKGQVKDNTGEPIKNVKLQMKSVSTGVTYDAMIDTNTGKYAIAIVSENNDEFLLIARKPNFTFSSNYIKPNELKYDAPITIDFEIKPIEIGTTVKINDIYFETNSAFLTKESMFVLNNFIEFLEDNPTLKVAIYGHTDNVGNDNVNLLLSQQRAKAVYDYLILFGIDMSRLSYKGFGKTKPIASNQTEAGRALNRRTEFVIIDK